MWIASAEVFSMEVFATLDERFKPPKERGLVMFADMAVLLKTGHSTAHETYMI